MKGMVKTFNIIKGYGFIYGNDGKEYYFGPRNISSADYLKNLQEGELVEFEVTQSDKGLKALNIKKIILF